MLRLSLFIAIFFFASSVKAAILPSNYGYKFCNKHQFNFLLLKVYDVYLCLDDKEFLYPQKIFKSDFSLIIDYDMNFDKNELSKSSIEEINRYYQLDRSTQKKYYNHLLSIFPNVKKGDVIEAKFLKESVIIFYHNGVFTGKITDKKFAPIFLNIWLHRDNKYQRMIKDLFKND